MNKPILFEKPSFDEALTRTPKTLGEAKEQLSIVREHLAGKKQPQNASASTAPSQDRPFSEILGQNERVLAETRGLIEASPGEKIFVVSGKNVVTRSGKQTEVAALEETAAYKRLFVAMEAAKDGREKYRLAAELGELRRTYGTGRK